MGKKPDTVVTTTSGALNGVKEEGILVFKGIPYAMPPVGNRRWMPPEPLRKWAGIRSATTFGAVSPQTPEELQRVFGRATVIENQSEDCLFLNIWTPGLDGKKRPVMVWIHGGAFRWGAGSKPGCSGATLARRGNVVIITINYRLGMFGFLRLKEITNGVIPSTGNEGILDQVMALTWVKDNISAFGGDPGNVTVFGCSSGGMSAGILMTMPQAKGLFHKAILQSGFPNFVHSLKSGQQTAEQFLALSRLEKTDLYKLCSFSYERLLEIQDKLAPMFVPWNPLVDGEIIPKPPMEALTGGAGDGVPVIVGSNLNEHKLYIALHPQLMTDADNLRRLIRFQTPGEDISSIFSMYAAALQKRGALVDEIEILLAMLTDREFRIPGLRFIDTLRQRGNRVFNYLFTWDSPLMNGRLGACHTLESGFVFGTYTPNFGGIGPEAVVLSAAIQDAWTSFARTGDPSTIPLPWPEYGPERNTMIFGRANYVAKAPYETERQAWEGIPDYTPE